MKIRIILLILGLTGIVLLEALGDYVKIHTMTGII